MLSQLNQRLAEARGRGDRLTKLEKQVQNLEQEQAELQQEVKQLQSELAAKKQDVAKLERMSLTSLLLTMLGKKEGRLEASQQEIVSTTFKLRQAEQRLKDVTADLETLRQEVSTLQGAREEYEHILTEKKAAILVAGDANAERLARLDEKEYQIQWQMLQIREARQAAHEADAALAQLEECLLAARRLGAWDLLGGGGVVTFLKHSRLDDAEQAAMAARHALDRLRRELRDVVETPPEVSGVSMGHYLRAADYFLDGLAIDWVVQNKIWKSQERARSVRQQLKSLIADLQHRLAKAESELRQVQEERTQFLTEAQ